MTKPVVPAPSHTHRRLRLGRALYEEFRACIADGTYAPGARLPSSRALAAERGISRATVALVYEQLAADGFIDTRPGAVGRVATGGAPAPGRIPQPQRAGTVQGPSGPLSAIGQRIAALALRLPAPAAAGDIDFVYGPLAGSDFPTLGWMQALRAVERQRRRRLEYDDPRGLLALRQALQAHLAQTRGLVCSVEQLLIVNGSQQALDLCARLLVDPGDAVAVENPGYRMAHHAFEAYGARLQFLDVDAQGVVTGQLARLEAVKLAYVTPTHQFPLGAFLPVGRRRELLDWAAQHEAWIIEDDYDSEYRYAVRPEPALQSLDTQGRVIHVGTFSKTLSPQLRLGYMVLPPALVEPFATAKRLTDRHAATGVQGALALLIEQGGYGRHVRRIRRMQHARQQALVQALERHLGARGVVQGTASGLHVVVWFQALPARAEPALVAAAQRRGVRVYPITPLFHPQAPGSQRPRACGLIMGYALLEPALIEQGVQRLAQTLDEVERHHRQG